MKVSLWITIISSCLVGITVDSAIIREYRDKARLNKDSFLNSSTDARTNGHHISNPPNHGGTRPHRTKSRRRTFRPNPTSCCKVGYKVAKRKLFCDVQLLEIVRKFNDMQRAKMKYNRPRGGSNNNNNNVRPTKISAKLSSKLGMCTATFPQFFEKCCKYRNQYYQRLSKCKSHAGNRERRKCRQFVRKHFKKNMSGDRSRSRGRGRGRSRSRGSRARSKDRKHEQLRSRDGGRRKV